MTYVEHNILTLTWSINSCRYASASAILRSNNDVLETDSLSYWSIIFNKNLSEIIQPTVLTLFRLIASSKFDIHFCLSSASRAKSSNSGTVFERVTIELIYLENGMFYHAIELWTKNKIIQNNSQIELHEQILLYYRLPNRSLNKLPRKKISYEQLPEYHHTPYSQ